MMENIRPIKTERDYNWALKEIARYFDHQPKVGSREGDRFDVLATLIGAYEDKHYPVEAPDAVTAIQAHMEFKGLTQSALSELLGSRSRASEVLARRRRLTIGMAYKLSREWAMPAEMLLKPYRLKVDKPSKKKRIQRSPAAAA